MPPSKWERVLEFPLTRGVIAVVMVLGPALLIQWPIAKFHLERTVWFLVAGVVMAAVVILMYRTYVRWIERRAPTELGPPRIGAEVVAGMVIGALLFTTTIGILRALGRYQVLGTNSASVLVYPLAGSIVSGVLEEVLFRGVLFRLVEERLGSGIALAVSAVLFGAAHLANPGPSVLGAASIVIEAGILLAGAYLLTRRLWLPIGMHFAWNFTESGVFGVEDSGHRAEGLLQGHLNGPTWLTGGAFGPEASVIAVGICLAAGVEFIALAVRRGHWVKPFWSRRSAATTIAAMLVAGALLLPGRARAAAVVVLPESTTAAIAPDSVLLGGWSGPADSSLVTVLLVRHAEKNTAMLGPDVPLSDAGRRRAQALARVAREAGVTAVYVTPTLRAKQTAAPIAQALGDTLTVVDSIDETVARLRTRHWGRTVLVVGHSDTVPQIIRGLTGRKAPLFGPEFDVLYVVTLARDGRSSVTRLRYGEP